ncbi:MAG: acyl carrier protein [Erysipelotrichaceae bacterium]|nr:acyl carrier protein [Erysipelotrichaceae bacterium]MBR4483563.1 acyl carrier protein [Erysipelotrichaceae bacterium]MCR5095949.1 acyl carrier protein [Erysipelotrichaceae bacterium]
MNKEISEQLKEIIYDYLGDEPELSEDTLLTEDLGLSSLDLVSIVGDIEDSFGIEVDDKAVPAIRTVGDAVAYIDGRMKQ